MIITYQKIINIPAMELKTQTQLGMVVEIVFNKTNFNIAGFLIRKKGFSILNKMFAVSAGDVIEISAQALIAKDDDSLTLLNETVRLKEAVKDGFTGVNQTVYTKSGKRIGKVIDLFIESENLSVSKLIVKGMISERLIPSHQIVEVKGKKIIIKDDFEMAKGSPAMANMMI